MNHFSLDDLRAVLGAVPPEPAVPDRAAAVRRRVRQVRQRRSAVGAVALALPVAGLGLLHADGPRRPATGHAPATPHPAALPTLDAGSAWGSRPAPTVRARPTALSEEATDRPVKTRPSPRVVHPRAEMTVSFTASATEVEVGQQVIFNLTWYDDEGHWKGYELSYGDSNRSQFKPVVCETDDDWPRSGHASFPHAWSEPGTYRVTYTVHTGGCGAANEAVARSIYIVVRAAEPEPTPAPAPESPSPEPSASAAAP